MKDMPTRWFVVRDDGTVRATPICWQGRTLQIGTYAALCAASAAPIGFFYLTASVGWAMLGFFLPIVVFAPFAIAIRRRTDWTITKSEYMRLRGSAAGSVG